VILAAALAAQVTLALSPCTLEGVPGEVKCGTHTVREDNRSVVETALAGRMLFGGNRLAAGFFLSVSCTEDIPYLSKDADTRAAATFGGSYRLDQQRGACNEWPRGTVSSTHRQPTKSATPTLLLPGEFDPVTPPSGAEEVLRHLSKGRHVVIRNNGHPIGNAETCIGQMIGQFPDRGSAGGLDQACAAANPAPPFVVPDKKAKQ
jgi:pimeloyl-ACP methyl ester carboxylesterase